MNLKDLLISYKQVDLPQFIQEPIESPKTDNLSRLFEFKSNTIPQEQPAIKNKFDWSSGIKGTKQEQIQFTVTPITFSNEIKTRAINQLKKHGFNDIQIRGIIGNLQQESGFNPFIISRDGRNSYGLAQWTGNRRLRLHSKYGQSPTVEQQIDFLVDELNSSEKSTMQALQNAKTVEETTRIFMDKFERPHKNHANFEARLKYANS